MGKRDLSNVEQRDRASDEVGAPVVVLNLLVAQVRVAEQFQVSTIRVPVPLFAKGEVPSEIPVVTVDVGHEGFVRGAAGTAGTAGALAGAVIGGPVGAAIGGAVGGVVGAITAEGRYRQKRSAAIAATRAAANRPDAPESDSARPTE